jgi:hypothetical protein
VFNEFSQVDNMGDCVAGSFKDDFIFAVLSSKLGVSVSKIVCKSGLCRDLDFIFRSCLLCSFYSLIFLHFSKI